MRYFLEIAYDGTAYHGWQVQPNAISVQQVIEEILHKLLGTPISVVGAGRTDAGVHSLGNVISFQSEKEKTQYIDLLKKEMSEYSILPTECADALGRVFKAIEESGKN